MTHYPQSPSDLSKQVVEYAISDEGANYIEIKLAEATASKSPNPETNRWKFLVLWVTECICTRPEIIQNAKSPESIYAKMYEIWCDDVQLALQEIFRQAQENEE